jgi:hypothetical protein
VIAEAIAFTIGTRRRIFPSLRWNASMTASVPCPSASGANPKTMAPATSAPITSASGSNQTFCGGNPTPPSMPGAGGRNRPIDSSRAHCESRKARSKRIAPIPATTPIDALSRIQRPLPPNSGWRKMPKGVRSQIARTMEFGRQVFSIRRYV